MPTEETRRILSMFEVAVINLENALDRRAPSEEVAAWDRVLAERTREVINCVETLRSRRIG
jgi:hypothetical protein